MTILINGKPVDYSLLPEHMREGAKNYVEEGIIPGSFLYFILCNDFVRAACHADDINQQHLFSYAKWLYLNCPSAAWGAPGNIHAWAASRRKGT